MVMNKLRPWAPPLTETMDVDFLNNVVDTLFPAGEACATVNNINLATDALPQELDVTEEELFRAIKKMSRKNTAPGPDGFTGEVWTLSILGPRPRRLFSTCVRSGKIPRSWKTGGLVQLRKPGKPEESPGACRPIVLLDEIGQLFKRIIHD